MKRYHIEWLWTGWATTFGRWLYCDGESHPQRPIGWRFRPIQRRGCTLDIGPLRITRYPDCTCP
jgi:hypothetical protein